MFLERNEFFLPALSNGSTKKVLMQGINRLTVKQAGLEIPNPNKSTWEKCVGIYCQLIPD